MIPKLKSIELQGYKTFANKSGFAFPASITAIVGPNGSGKSNISDAVRWVLGEQSYQLLRGRKTMDMIFSGSEQKARASMAAVTITFDNQEHWLPIDFEEVSISRRAFRDGQNEYLINGQKVRLRDVIELLSQSGLAERTYTIIGQGLIDSALSLKPDDRRKFFEEAAGIGLFRSRREEALNRLTETHRNMERIGDILSELEPRVRSLEKQAKRAAEYGSVQDSLQNLLSEWYGYHWHQAQSSLLVAIERSKQQELIAEGIRQEFQKAEQKNNQLQDSVRKSRARLTELHNQLSVFHREMEQLGRNTAVTDERLRAAQNQIKDLSDESARIDEELNLLISRKQRSEEELSETQQKLAEAREQKTKFDKELSAKQQELNELRRQLAQKRNQTSGIEAKIVQLRARQEEMQSRSDSLRSSAENSHRALDESHARLIQAEKELTQISQIILDKQSQVDDLNQKQKVLEEKSTACEQLKRQLNEEKSKTEAENARLVARLDVLKAAEENLSGLDEGAQFLLKHVRQGKITQKISPLEGKLIVKPEHEIAVAAALGENLDAVMTENEHNDFLMDLLHSGNNGRAVLLAKNFKAADIPSNPTLKGCVRLSELVTCDSSLQTLITRLLGSTWLVENRQQAASLHSALQAGETLVTPQGDLFRANGAVVSGTETRHQILSRPREMLELESKCQQNKSDIHELAQKITSASTEAEQCHLQLTQNTRQRKQLDSELADVQKRLNQASIEKEKQKQITAFQEQRINDYEADIATAINAVQTALATQSESETQLKALQDETRELSNSIHQIQIDDLQNQAQHWGVSCAVIEGSIKEIQNRIREHDAQISKNNTRKENSQNRIRTFEAQIEQLNSQKTEYESSSQGVSQSAAEIEGQINPVEIMMHQQEEELTSVQSDYQERQQRISSADRLVAQTQIELARQNDQLESLKKRIEDDFGLVAFTYKDQISGQTPLPFNSLIAKLPQVEEISFELENQITQMKLQLRRMGAINPDAVEEYQSVSERYTFLKSQAADLKKADEDLHQVIKELDGLMETSFQETFENVQREFRSMFTRLFGGGSAKLMLTDPNDVNESGIEIEAKLPGHREQELSLLSGGERSLTSVALVFALLRVSPTPFCIMDEVDAALDEANVGRFCELLKELSKETQFLLITHNRNTVETADVIYGITMGSDSASRSVSLRLDEVDKNILK